MRKRVPHPCPGVLHPCPGVLHPVLAGGVPHLLLARGYPNQSAGGYPILSWLGQEYFILPLLEFFLPPLWDCDIPVSRVHPQSGTRVPAFRTGVLPWKGHGASGWRYYGMEIEYPCDQTYACVTVPSPFLRNADGKYCYRPHT